MSQDLRQGHRQQSYRKESDSANKDEQHVAHIASLSLVEFIQGRVPGPPALDQLREFANSDDNLKMVAIETNLITHQKQDKAFKDKYYSGEPLTKREEVRAREIVDALSAKPGHHPTRSL